MTKQKKEKVICEWMNKECPFPDFSRLSLGCIECLLGNIYSKLDSTLPLQKKALETWIDLMKIIAKEIEKERKKR